MKQEAWTGLGDAIAAIREELQSAIAPSAGVRFRAGAVELEFTVDVHKDANGKVNVKVFPWLGAEGGGARSTGSAHRLKITLQPVDSRGDDSVIASRLPEQPE